jgi:membrane protease YdiL (CAAX protease family)
MQQQSSFRKKNIISDPQFLVALSAGPVTWCVLFVILNANPDWGWPLNAPLTFLLPALLYPVIEEIIFRGYLQSLLAARLDWHYGPLTLANLLTSLVFSGMHLFYNPPLWAMLVFFPSLVFGYFRERHNNLLAPILLHCFYNAGFIWLFSAPG